MRSSCMTVRVPAPPGTTRISGWATSANDFSTSMVSIRVSVLTGPGSPATKSTRAPGRRESTSYGPIASSAVKRSNNGIAICISFSSCLEPLAVVGRAHAQPPVERAPHGLDGAEAAVAGDGVELLAGRLQAQARLVDAQRLDVRRRGHAQLAPERTREVAGAHAGARGERLDGEVVPEMVGQPRLQLAERLALGELGAQVRAELGLPAAAARVDDEPARRLQRHLAAEVLLHQCQRKVHPGGDT